MYRLRAVWFYLSINVTINKYAKNLMMAVTKPGEATPTHEEKRRIIGELQIIAVGDVMSDVNFVNNNVQSFDIITKTTES